MEKTLFILSCGITAILLVSCTCDTELEQRFGINVPREKIIAIRTSDTISLDGNLNEDAWKKAPAYAFASALRNYDVIMPKVAENPDTFESGTVKLLYDDKYLYIGAVLQDSDVVQYGKENQESLFLQGDTFEIFLKSEKSPRYWETYATPNDKKTTIRFESRNYARLNWGKVEPDFRVSATIQGTFNNYNDRDAGWIAEVAIPFKMFEDLTGRPFDKNEKWTILLGRYNYTFGQKNRQLSTIPQLPISNFHLFEYYGELLFK